jgi:hypothetical protein
MVYRLRTYGTQISPFLELPIFGTYGASRGDKKFG